MPYDAAPPDAYDAETGIAVTRYDGSVQFVDAGDASPPNDAAELNDAGVDAAPAVAMSCRTAADCPPTFECSPPEAVPRPCRGIACPSDFPGCYGDDGCGASELCQTYRDLNCRELYRRCGPHCTSDADCSGTVCQPGGHCLPAGHCNVATDVCTTPMVCEPRMGALTTGCAHPACASDADCRSGFCLSELCYGSLGYCTPKPPVCLAP